MKSLGKVLLIFVLFGPAVVLLLNIAISYRGEKAQAPRFSEAHDDRIITFNRDVAPIVFRHCSSCHRPGQSAPFSLLSYREVEKRARQIQEVIANGFMPPWLPESEPDEFHNQRTLDASDIETIETWVTQGRQEGAPEDLPVLPKWPDDWQLGEPDRVAVMQEVYDLPAEGVDVYRNFVIPIEVTAPAWVRTVEIRPGNPRIVHHAVLMIDQTPSSRDLDRKDPTPGFGGDMSTGQARLPDGHFFGWTPGKVVAAGDSQLAWRLTPGTDLVLQLHMRPSGKVESVQPAVGLYFTDQPPTHRPYALVLRTKQIDIPAGEPAYPASTTYTLPVDVTVLSVYPHAHYLGSELNGSAIIPGGTERRLIHIPKWDFNWQDEYRFRKPIQLPKGTIIQMNYTYDNSASNPLNPNSPPIRVRYGQQSTDEMAELMLQVVPQSEPEWHVLRDDMKQQAFLEAITSREKDIQAEPQESLNLYRLGMNHLQVGNLVDASVAFTRFVSTASESEHLIEIAKAYSNLGLIAQSQQSHAEAAGYLQSAFEFWKRADSPEHESQVRIAYANLLAQQGQLNEALEQFIVATTLTPADPKPFNDAAWLLLDESFERRDPNKALEFAKQATTLTHRQDPTVLRTLAAAHQALNQNYQAKTILQEAIQIANDAQAFDVAAVLQADLDRLAE